MGCSNVHDGGLEDFDADLKTGETKQLATFAQDCQKLRLKVRDTPDPTTPQDAIAITAAEQHLAALEAKSAPKVEIEAATRTLEEAKAALAADTEANSQKKCGPDGSSPTLGDAAACLRLHRALSSVKILATNDVTVAATADALKWATEWRDRRADVTDGQILFETNCARCHTKNWSIFDPTRVALKPEDLLGAPGGGGSLGFNLRNGELQRRFAATRGPDGELAVNSGELSHTRFILEGSVFARPYGLGGRGSGMMPGQCNDAVKSDGAAPKLKYYGCMLSSASTPSGGAPSKDLDADPSGGIDDAMIEQIVAYERCGLDGATNKLEASIYPTTCKSE